MKSARIFVITILLLAAATVYVQAEERPYLRANVPFAFTVGNVDLPAGSYEISLYPLSGDIQIRNVASAQQAIVTSFAGSRLDPSWQSKLTFHRVEGHYFLMQVWEQGNSNYRALRPGKLERELAKGKKQETTTILASAAATRR